MSFWDDVTGAVSKIPIIGGGLGGIMGGQNPVESLGKAVGGGLNGIYNTTGIGAPPPTITIPGAAAPYNPANPYQAQIGQAQGAFNGVSSQQKQLADQLRAQAAGRGPNPALSQLQSTTNSNLAQENAAVYGNRGLNPALAAKIASNNSAQAGQQSVNQAATLSAQQQMGAQQQLGGLYNEMGNQQLANQGQLLGANQAGNQLGYNAWLSPQQLAMQGAGIQAGYQGQTYGAGQQGKAGLVGGIAGGAGAAAAAAAHGGVIPSNYKRGGTVPGKANVKGDSTKNDTQLTWLSPGEGVIPRSKMNNVEKAKEFVDHMMKSKGGKVEANDSISKEQLHKQLKDMQAKMDQLKKHVKRAS